MVTAPIREAVTVTAIIPLHFSKNGSLCFMCFRESMIFINQSLTNLTFGKNELKLN